MSKGTLSNVAHSTNGYEAMEVVTPAGEHAMDEDDRFMEFHVDEQSLLSAIVQTFYDKVE
jgi:hypothetical protein